MVGRRDRELEVIPLSGDDEEGGAPRRSSQAIRTAVLRVCSLLAAAVLVILIAALISSRRTVKQLRLDIRAAVADPCHWLDVSDVEQATHAPMMMTTRTSGTATEYQQGCIYTLAEGPIRTVIVLVDTPRNPLYQRALSNPGGTLTLDRMTALSQRGVVVVVETPGALGPTGPVTKPRSTVSELV